VAAPAAAVPGTSSGTQRPAPSVEGPLLDTAVSEDDAWELLQEGELDMLTTLERLVSDSVFFPLVGGNPCLSGIVSLSAHCPLAFLSLQKIPLSDMAYVEALVLYDPRDPSQKRPMVSFFLGQSSLFDGWPGLQSCLLKLWSN
jgi:hypothetical protein